MPASASSLDKSYVNGKIQPDREYFARLSREACLNNMATARNLTERVYWALVLTSCCGPQVTEGCYLRNRDGYQVKDEHGNPIALKPHHLREMLSVPATSRTNLNHSIKRLIAHKRLTVKADIWMLVQKPNLSDVVSTDHKDDSDVVSTDHIFKLLGRQIDLSKIADHVVRTATAEKLEQIKNVLNTAINTARDCARREAELTYSAACNLITEENEELEEIRKSSSSSVIAPDIPEETTTTNAEQVLEAELPVVLAEYGKGALTQKQFSEVVKAISDLEAPVEAAESFLRSYLPEHLPRIRHPGSIPQLAREEFSTEWRQYMRLKSQNKDPVVLPSATRTDELFTYARSEYEQGRMSEEEYRKLTGVFGADPD